MANPCPTGRRGQGRKRKPWRGPQRGEATGLERPLTGEAGRWGFAERSGRQAACRACGTPISAFIGLGGSVPWRAATKCAAAAPQGVRLAFDADDFVPVFFVFLVGVAFARFSPARAFPSIPR